MQQIPNFHLEAFRTELERNCQMAIAPIKALNTQEACAAAEAKIDGIFGGLLSVAKGFSRRPWELEFMEIARDTAERYHRQIHELRKTIRAA